MPPEGLDGKVVLVTGSGCGLGASLARAAAERRARVVLNCRSDAARVEALAADLGRTGADAIALRADEALGAFGRIDVLLNTVGSFLWKPVADMDPKEWRTTVASNLDSVFNMCRLVLPSMRQNHFGRIVNLGAVGAERTLGQPEVAAYSAAKAAVIAFSKALALEEARRGITVNVICPGVFVDAGGAASGASVTQRVPVGRLGTHDDIVRAALFFACPAADFLTGQVLAVSGGAGV
jgi:NAD(P)-dependent dehydrogenase (short-subunit alcohol dehydrogenase family)